MAKLCVPDYTGHKEYDFTPNSPAAKRAEKIFNKLMNTVSSILPQRKFSFTGS
jgi:hypothetical protein